MLAAVFALALAGALTVALALGAPAPAYAQAGERAATAEDLFRQALQLTRRGRFAEACPKFAESHRLDPAYGALVNLAACYEKTGRTASAWQAYVDAAELARDKGQRARADSARKKADKLAPRLVRLELRLGAGMDAGGLAITRNDRPFDAGLLGNAVPVDPGSYTIVATRAGVEPWRTSVSATAPGKTTVIEIAGPIGRAPPRPAATPAISSTAPPGSPPASTPLRAPAPQSVAAARSHTAGSAAEVHERAPRDTAPERSRSRGLRRTGKTLVVGGLILGAAGSGLALVSRSISNDVTKVDMGERFEPALEERARFFEISAVVMWSAGAVALATGTTVYLVGRGRDERAIAVAPAVLPGGAGAQVAWRW